MRSEGYSSCPVCVCVCKSTRYSGGSAITSKTKDTIVASNLRQLQKGVSPKTSGSKVRALLLTSVKTAILS